MGKWFEVKGAVSSASESVSYQPCGFGYCMSDKNQVFAIYLKFPMPSHEDKNIYLYYDKSILSTSETRLISLPSGMNFGGLPQDYFRHDEKEHQVGTLEVTLQKLCGLEHHSSTKVHMIPSNIVEIAQQTKLAILLDWSEVEPRARRKLSTISKSDKPRSPLLINKGEKGWIQSTNISAVCPNLKSLSHREGSPEQTPLQAVQHSPEPDSPGAPDVRPPAYDRKRRRISSPDRSLPSSTPPSLKRTINLEAAQIIENYYAQKQTYSQSIPDTQNGSATPPPYSGQPPTQDPNATAPAQDYTAKVLPWAHHVGEDASKRTVHDMVMALADRPASSGGVTLDDQVKQYTAWHVSLLSAEHLQRQTELACKMTLEHGYDLSQVFAAQKLGFFTENGAVLEGVAERFVRCIPRWLQTRAGGSGLD